IVPQIRDELFTYMGGLVRECRAVPIVINGMPDHVHMLVSLPSTLAVAVLVREVKANSSRWVHERWPQRRTFSWQAGYGAFGVNHASREQVERYINNQEEHHRKMSFEAEFRALLRKHEIDFDERYLWK
ncbi:MAG TPA: transposase, partial [Chloroflexia bacterium]|nr:transposase [Chloroflexia bacterium]